jgi:two-component system sensor histidine kinase ChvG
MQPRALLILALFAALLLPWAGWQLVQQVEVVLREGQEQAQIATAQVMASALAATTDALPQAGPGLFVHPLSRAPLLDGGGDEYVQSDPARSTDGRLRVVVAEDPVALFALIDVADPTRDRADANDPLGRVGDRVELVVVDDRGMRTFVLSNAAPGALQVAAGSDSAGVPHGEWQETADGYRIELRLPKPGGRAALGITAIDHGGGAERAIPLAAARADTLPLLRPDPRLDQALALLAPQQTRVRLVSAEGWVLARAGAIEEAAPDAQRAAGSRWQALVYSLLLAPPEESAASDFGDTLPRLQAPVVWQALSGVAASNVRSSNSANSVIVAAAVPVGAAGEARGALLVEKSSDALLLLANRAVFGVMAISLIAVLLAALVLVAYAGMLSLRIRRLRNAAERALRPDGRLVPNLPHLSTRDDLGDLSRSFGQLLSEVGGYNDYLRSLASKLSHELQTPLAIVRSSLDNLEHEQLTPAARTYAQRAREGAERLSGILRSMAEASRMERIVAGADGEDFDLAELTRGCAEAYRDLVAPRRIVLEVPDGRLGIHGAPELIAQALDKLVDNARSFTPKDGWIRIRLHARENGAMLAVANNGPALPERMQERLFESLVSVRDGAQHGDAPHLGLGLFVVRLVAELHRGEATAVNLSDGAGVEFRLRLAGMPRAPL